MMREMQDPICPFSQYDAYMGLTKIPVDRRIYTLSTLLRNLPALNFNTLRFIIYFMREVIALEPYNRMTAYNIAVTVGPNIYRPQQVRPEDLFNAGTYYDVMIRMMENYDALFVNLESLENAEENNLLLQTKQIEQNSNGSGRKQQQVVGVIHGNFQNELNALAGTGGASSFAVPGSQNDEVEMEMPQHDSMGGASNNNMNQSGKSNAAANSNILSFSDLGNKGSFGSAAQNKRNNRQSQMLDDGPKQIPDTPVLENMLDSRKYQ